MQLINKLPTSALKEASSPHHTLFNKIPDYSTPKVFGCSCFPYLRPYNQHEFQFRLQECVYLGLSPHHKGHKCLAPNGHIYVSKDVKLNESSFPYKVLFFPASPESNSNTHTSTYSSSIPLVSMSNTNATQSCSVLSTDFEVEHFPVSSNNAVQQCCSDTDQNQAPKFS